MSKYFYVLGVVNDTPYRERVEYWCRNDPKKIKDIYAESPWMKDKQTFMYRVEVGKSEHVDIGKLKKVYDTDLSHIHVCNPCGIFYLEKQTCTECNKDAVTIEW